MTSRIPEKPSEHEAEGQPDPGYAEPGQLETGDAEATTEPSRDVAIAVEEFGTTAGEQAEGEPLDGRLSREEPEVLAQADVGADEREGADTPFDERAGQGVGRLVESDEGARSDTEAEMVATDVGTDLGGYSAEEAALHIEPEV